MNFEQELDKLGLVIQKGEEVFEISNDIFSEKQSTLPDEITIGMLLFRNVIEKLDAVFILLENATEQSAESITRDLFENMLYLKFILNEKYFKNRALAYYYSYLKDQLSFAKMISSDNSRGRKIREYMNKKLPNENIEKQKKLLKETMKKPCFYKIKNTWDRLEKKREFPKWYSLFNGPKSIKELAEVCDFEAEYHMLYRAYSSQVHSANAFRQIEKTEEGIAGIKELRVYNNPHLVLLAARSFGIAAIFYYIEFFLPESYEEFRYWYVEKIDQDILVRLADKF